MKQKAIKSTDDLILGIRSILSNDRCSFSVEDKVLLEDCISRLEETKSKPPSDPLIREEKLKVIIILMRVFMTAKHLIDIFFN